jgi:hypothetical protein
MSDSNNVTVSQEKSWSKPQHPWNSGNVHSFILALSGLKKRGTSCEQGFFTNNHHFSLLHGHDPTVGSRDKQILSPIFRHTQQRQQMLTPS